MFFLKRFLFVLLFLTTPCLVVAVHCSLSESQLKESITKLETDLHVELQKTELIALLDQTGLQTLNVLASWLTPLLLQMLHLVTLLEQTSWGNTGCF